LAQSGAAAPPDANAASTQDDTKPAPKKKGGLFGKVKGLAKNNVVKAVAKTAACTMVPGGQLIAGAIDGASTKSAAKAAATDAVTGAATSAATNAVKGVAGGAVSALAGGAGGGNPCMPGMGMMGNAGAAAMAGGVPGAGLPGMPNAVMPGAGMSAAQMKQMQEQYRKMGIDPATIQAMQQQMMAGAAAGMVNVPDDDQSEPPEATAPALTREKGHIVLRQLPWMPASEGIQAGREAAFGLAIHTLAADLLPTGKHYKIEVKVEDQGGKAPAGLLARKRAVAVASALASQGVSQDRLSVADGGADRDPRVSVSESKASK
jgi:hypothetical protein